MRGEQQVSLDVFVSQPSLQASHPIEFQICVPVRRTLHFSFHQTRPSGSGKLYCFQNHRNAVPSALAFSTSMRLVTSRIGFVPSTNPRSKRRFDRETVSGQRLGSKRKIVPIPIDLEEFEPAVSIHPKTAHILCGTRLLVPPSSGETSFDSAHLAGARGGPSSLLLKLSRASFHDRSIGSPFGSVFRRSRPSMARNQLQMDVAMDDHLFVLHVASARHVVFAATRQGRCLRRGEVRGTWNGKCWWTSSACSIRRSGVAWEKRATDN